jgi:hypothetical protein
MSAHPVTEAQLSRLHELRRQLGWSYPALRLESRERLGADPDRLLRCEADALIERLVDLVRGVSTPR